MLADEEVLGLDVAMDDVEVMHVGDAFEHLVGQVLDFGGLR
jgi:hypothetical protein